MTEITEAAIAVRDLWIKKPVDNSPEWQNAILALVQAVDRKYRPDFSGDYVQ